MLLSAPEVYLHIKSIFEKNGIESPQFEAMCLIEHIFKKRLSSLLLTKPEATQEQITFANNIAYRRISGEPLQYLLGEWEFYGMPFCVGKGVLIPRQDTETLVEAVINSAGDYDTPKIIDLCSGSGCIACAVAKYAKNAQVYALEVSERALGYLNKNIRKNAVDVQVVAADVLSEKQPCDCMDFDIIVSNPPYLTKGDMENLQKEVSFEPEMALFGGEDGLHFYREITRIWKNRLKTGGMLAFEIGMGQHEDVRKIMNENNFDNIEFIKDLCGIIRVVTGRKK